MSSVLVVLEERLPFVRLLAQSRNGLAMDTILSKRPQLRQLLNCEI